MQKKGFTLIETLIAIGLSSVVAGTALTYAIKDTKKTQSEMFSSEVAQLINGVDQRLFVDGYDYNKWTNKKSWNNEEIKDLINKDLQAINSSCGKGSWIPDNGENKLQLVNCNLFEKRKFNVNINAKLEKDPTGFINKFTAKYQFNDEQSFESDFLMFKIAMDKLKASKRDFKTGTLFIEFKDKSTNANISASECISKKTNCILSTTLDRQGGGEYLKVDGKNSMIGSKIKFIKSKGETPLLCVKWKKNASGLWSKDVGSECGIGIYDDTATPVVVETSLKTGTFENIYLTELCDKYIWNNSTEKLELNGQSPCGISKDGTSITQVLTNNNVNKAYINNGYVSFLTSDQLKSNRIDAKILKIIGTANFDGETKFKGSSVQFDNDRTIINGNKLDINSIETFFKNGFYSKGIITGDNLVIKGKTDLTNTTTTKLIVNDSIYLNGVALENENCPYNGEIKKDSTGGILNCINGKWESGRSTPVPIGSVVIWTSKAIPKGWIEMNGQPTAAYPKLRDIVGHYVPDLRGMFVRGLDNGRTIDNNRELKSYQTDADQKFTAKWNVDDRSARWPSGIAASSYNPNSGGADGGDRSSYDMILDNSRQIRTATESRPKNIALIYIIKAM